MAFALHSVSITHQFLSLCVCLPNAVSNENSLQLWPKMKSSIAFAKLREKVKKKYTLWHRTVA